MDKVLGPEEKNNQHLQYTTMQILAKLYKLAMIDSNPWLHNMTVK